jgi:hypothetical protein
METNFQTAHAWDNDGLISVVFGPIARAALVQEESDTEPHYAVEEPPRRALKMAALSGHLFSPDSPSRVLKDKK